MKKFIKTKLNEFLNEMLPLDVTPKLGTRQDIELAQVLQAKPFFELLQAVRADWGKTSDLYNALLPLYISDRFDMKRLIEILKNYDVYEDYKPFLNLNETK